MTYLLSDKKRTRARKPLIMEIRRNNRKRGSTNLEIGFDPSANSCLFYWCRNGNERRRTGETSTCREIPYGWNFTIVDTSRKRRTFFCTVNPSPCLRCQRSRTLVFDISVQRPWSLARGSANELRQHVTQKHVVISHACVKVCAVIPETK